MKLVATLFHVVSFSINFGTLIYDLVHITNGGQSTWEYRGYGGKFKHLTFWDQIIQTVFFGFALLNDIFGSNTKSWDPPRQRSTLQRIRDHVAASIVFPMGCFVVITFWGIYAIDRELVFPKVLDKIVPSWLNHIMHTTPIVFLLIEKYFVYHHYPSRKNGFSWTIGVALTYQLWILWIAYHADIWVYPVLQVLSWPGRLVFFAACWIIMFGMYMFGEKYTKIMWQPSQPLQATKVD